MAGWLTPIGLEPIRPWHPDPVPGSGAGVAYIVRSWPRLSQTFILNEALALESLGAEVEIFALVAADEAVVQPQVAALRGPVRSLAAAAGRPRRVRRREHVAVARRAPLRYLRTAAAARVRTSLSGGYATSSSWACFGHAVHLAATLGHRPGSGRRPPHLHAHFAHDPALVALFTHRLTAIDFSFTAHARDLYGVSRAALVARVRRASAVVTCCEANAKHLRAVLPPALHPRIRLVPHGVDLDAFRPPPTPPGNLVPHVVSVGRLVEKKGFDDLLCALARVKSSGRAFTCTIFGEGPRQRDLEALRDHLGLGREVVFAGPRTQPALVPELQGADVFALTPFVTADGDRDGVPNVVAEAMACARPVVATAVGGIPDLIDHGRNGLLADSHDVDGIASRLALVLDDPGLAHQLGQAGRRTVEERFDAAVAARQLASLFSEAVG